MTNTVIKVEGLSKRYRIGAKAQTSDTFGRAATKLLLQPLRNLRRLRSLSHFDEDGRHTENIIWALHDISFEVKHGEALGIIGRNGSGKSTLLKILSRITEPTSGRAVVRGKVASLLEVGTGFHPELTGRDNTYLNGAILGMSRKEISRKFDEIVDFSGVEQFIDTPVKHYSTGMKVRLAFSVAAHLEPEILLIDEVLAVGDAEFQSKCLGKMGTVAAEGRTVLFVSHNMSAITTLTQESVLLDAGGMIRKGDTPTVIEAYKALFHTEGELNVDALPRKSQNHGTDIRICSVSADYDAGSDYQLHATVRFTISVKSRISRSDLAVGITISDIAGVPIMSSVTERAVTVHSGESSSFQIEIADPRLAPGGYQLGISIVDGELSGWKEPFDAVNPCLTFSILNGGPGHAGTSVFWKPYLGSIIMPPSSIRVRQVERKTNSERKD